MKKNLNLILVILGIVAINLYAFSPEFNFVYYTRNILPIFWILNFIIAIILTLNEKARIKAKADRIYATFIVVSGLLIIYFLSGLLVDYAYSPYNHSISSILRNFYYLVLPVVLQVYVFATIIHFSKKKILTSVFSMFLLVFSTTNTYLFFIQSNTPLGYFENFFLILLPVIIQSMVIIYLIYTSGVLVALTYIFPIKVIIILLPFFPDYSWFLFSMKHVIIAVLVFFAIDNIHMKKVLRLSRRKIKSEGFLKSLPTFLILTLMVLFVTRVFTYYPVAILSNSMNPSFSRGSVVIVNKSSSNLEKLEKGDIIKYKYDNSYVIHRIIEIKELGGETYFQTKGDANRSPDIDYVNIDDVSGVIKHSVPYLGFPSVWLTEIFTGKDSEANIELG